MAWWVWTGGIAIMLAFMLARGGTRASDRKQGEAAGPSPCLTDRSCAIGWHCYVVPKDDPFAVEGECSQGCADDLQCPSQYRCEKVSVGEKGPLVVPLNASGATAQTTGVCRSP